MPKVSRPLSIGAIRPEGESIGLFDSYRRWAPRRLPDPRTASVATIAQGIVAIVTAEGPVLAHRATRLYTQAAGLSRAGREIQGAYAKAIRLAVKQKQLEAEPDGSDDELVLRPAGTPPVRLRERDERALDEIPLAEITALVRKLEVTRGEAFASPEERFRRVLEAYELVRLTAKSKARLEAAVAAAALPQWNQAITSTFEPEEPLGRPTRSFRTRPRLRHG
jgi:hypothetical protein